MITTGILNAIYGLVWIILIPIRALPTAILPEGFSSAISSLGAYISPLEVIIPITTIAAVLGLFLALESGIFLWSGINWIIRRIPTQS